MTEEAKEAFKRLYGRIVGLMGYCEETEESLHEWQNEKFLKQRSFQEILNCMVISNVEAKKTMQYLQEIYWDFLRLKKAVGAEEGEENDN